MATARMTAPAPIGLVDSSTSGFMDIPNAAVVDAYATRVLKMKSPPEANFDESLGPYVTSLLREALADSPGFDSDVVAIPEFDSLMELLEEHCSIDRDSAQSALHTIASAVKTGVMEPPEASGTSGSESNIGEGYHESPWSTSLGSNQESSVESLHLIGEGLESSLTTNSASISSQVPPTEAPGIRGEVASPQDRIVTDKDDRSTSSTTASGTPLKPDRLIPVDLLGVLDDPSTPTSMKDRYKINAFEEFPPPECVPQSLTKKTFSEKSKKNSKEEAKDLAAALFRPARSRHNDIDNDAKSPKLKPVSGNYGVLNSPSLEPSAPAYFPATEENHVFQHQLDSAVEILLSMNPELGGDAASEASLISNMDINVAQYVIDGALSAPPVCRHMLNEGCYRSDCQFSHDVEGHTCLFWLRGRCGKGGSCRFLHGYSEKLLEGINTDLLPEQSGGRDDDAVLNAAGATMGARSEPLPIQTANLVEHNVNMSFSAPQHSGSPFTFISSANGFETSAFTFPPQSQSESHFESLWDVSALDSSMKSVPTTERQSTTAAPGPSISFASIASKGYNKASFSQAKQSSGIGSALASSSSKGQVASQTIGFERIPQDLWNPHINRNSEVFHIADPLERFREVSSSVSRNDVIDLHFQSTKTFRIVMSSILPEKLREHGQVWVVTGTGHHVGSQTHQKGGGTLESAVSNWLASEGYNFVMGRDRNGYGGALLVKS